MESTGKKKHLVRNYILAMLLVAAAAFGISVLVSYAMSANRIKKMNEQLSLGVRYMTELDYEMAVAQFDQVLVIDDKNVAAYIGSALAYTQMGDNQRAIEILAAGVDYTESGMLAAMLADVQGGKSLEDRYALVETEDTLEMMENPFATLELLGSEYHQWDFDACAQLFGFDYEEYAGQSTDLGVYEGLNIHFDGTGENVDFSLSGDGFSYGYRLLGESQLQIFRIEKTGAAENPIGIGQIVCSLEMGRSYAEVLSELDLQQMEENTYYIADSNIGKVGYMQWQEGNRTKLYLFQANKDLLGLELTFQGDKLVGAAYRCGVPNNLRSRVIAWIAELIH